MAKYRGYLKLNPKIRSPEIIASSEGEAVTAAAAMLDTACDNITIVKASFLTCPKCSYRWRFSGRRKIFATCPQCLKQIPIEEAKK